jgi:gas vesicle protein
MSNYLNDMGTDAATRSDDPEVIRRDIEATRAELSRDVDALTEKVSPARVVERRVDKAKEAVGSVKEKVMGVHSGSTNGALGTATDKAASVASSVGDTATAAPSMARQKTRGNPLAAGVIAFGVGWLVSSLMPATEKEQQAATAVKDKASEHSDTLTQPIKEAAGNAKENLAGPAQEAVQAVKGTATEAASTVKDEASSAKDDVAGSAQQAKDEVRQSASY